MPPSPGQPIRSSDARTSRDALRSGFLRSSLPPRTQAGFVAATLAVFLIAFLSYRSFKQRAEGARLVARTLDVTAHLEVLLSTFQDAETGQRGFLLTGDDHYLEPYGRAVATLDSELPRLRALIADNLQQVDRFDALEHSGHSKMAELKQTIDLRHSGRPDESLAVVKTDRGKRYMDEIRVGVAAMKEAERKLLDTRTQELAAASSFVTEVIWGGSALLLFLIAAAAALSSRDFLEQRVQGWLRAGQSEMAVGMQGVDLTATLGERVAAFLSGYLDAQIGAVYFAPSRGALERVGGYALPEGAAASGPAGLTKQAYAQNTTITTEDVPGDFFPVNSGLGKSRARHLVVAPTTADGAPNGAIELGFFHPIRPYDRELLAPAGRADRSGAAGDEGSQRPQESPRRDPAPGRGAADATGGAPRTKRRARAAEPHAAGLAGPPGEPAGRARADQRQPRRADAGAGETTRLSGAGPRPTCSARAPTSRSSWPTCRTSCGRRSTARSSSPSCWGRTAKET